ncbi:MAG TPA: ATP-grasp fold amidoligase family protein [Caulobacteraceae bacterium]|nr:ATP-grasp fold amidoligase family protein [Caulobacteraceae bacterium]
MNIEWVVRDSLVDQIRSMVAAGRWPRERPPDGYMRGVDFYNPNDLVSAIIVGAQIFKNAHGYIPPLSTPKSFSERLYARKYFAPLPMPSLADKLEAQAYVRSRLGDAFLPSVVWVGDSVDELCAAKLPPGRFVLKANHGWGYNLPLTLPHDLEAQREGIKRTAGRWLASRFGYDTGEWQYCTFQPRLFLEQFIEFNGEEPPDEYKVFCFHGRTQFINFHLDRFSEHKSAIYDTDWNLLPVHFGRQTAYRDRPRNVDAIVEAAERISADLTFARVDLYSNGQDKISFSEITYTPGNTTDRFSQPEFDIELGRLLDVGI